MSALQRHLDLCPRILILITQEEDLLLEDLKTSSRGGWQVNVWNPTFGLLELDSYLAEYQDLKSPENPRQAQLNSVLRAAYKTPYSEKKGNLYYVFLDAHPYLKDSTTKRLLKNIAISAHRNSDVCRTLIFPVGSLSDVPSEILKFSEILDLTINAEDYLKRTLQKFEEETRSLGLETSLDQSVRDKALTFTLPHGRKNKDPYPPELLQACRGLTSFQLNEALIFLSAEKDFKIETRDIQRKKREILANVRGTNFTDVVETKTRFEDVAGLYRLKTWLKEAGASYSEEGSAWGLPPSKGVLLTGLPGCGKSLTAKALGNEWGRPLVKLDPGSLFAGRVGQSEANVRAALREIETLSPCIVWVDEIEKGFSGLEGSSRTDGGTTARVIGTFLTWFEEHSEDVFLVATSNNMSALPPEMVSRFEEVFFVGLPSEKDRRECFEVLLRKKWNPQVMGDLSAIDFEQLTEHSKGFTGREIEQVLNAGLRSAFVRGRGPLTPDFLEALNAKAPLSRVMAEDIEAALEWVGYDEDRDEGIRARYAGEPPQKKGIELSYPIPPPPSSGDIN